jgi:hypothetical protein
MKRFHVHEAVHDVDANIRFYCTMLGTSATVLKEDYAQWMLDDPRVNFAVSRRGGKPAVDHLGAQFESNEQLSSLRGQVERVEIAALDQPNAACCYAPSDEYWVTDAQGIAWETLHTLDPIPVYGADSRVVDSKEPEIACCAPALAGGMEPAKSGACCG